MRAGAPVPEPWVAAPRFTIDTPALEGAGDLVATLHRQWAQRQPVVIEWDVADDALAASEASTAPVWSLDAGFLFPLERLRFLCFSNNYDGRNGEPRWWWSHKAERSLRAEAGGSADVLLPDGGPAWIDGGPRSPLDLTGVVHGDSVDAGLTAFVPRQAPDPPPGLAPDQAEAVTHVAGAARIIAPAGSGKTRTLAARLQHLMARGVEPGYVMALAYNTRAAEELRARTGVNRGTVRTIHSLGWQILNEAHNRLDLIAEPEVRDVLGRIISVPQRVNTDSLGPYLEALEQVRAGLMDPVSVETSRDDVPGLADGFDDYRRRLYERGRVDHGEQVYGAIEALLNDPELRSRWQRRCRYVLVDEFQDLTPAYLLLIRLVASPQLDVFGVGDDDQVIYGYAGADPGFLIDFGDYFPGAGHHALEINYRSPHPVVAAARTVLSYNDRRIDKTITASHQDPDPGALQVERLTDGDLARRTAELIAGWMAEGVEPGSIAVLTRVNSSLIPVKAALVEAGVPVNSLVTAQNLHRTTLRALFAWLRLAGDPERMARTDLLEAVRRPGRGLTRLARELIRRPRHDLAQLAGLAEPLDGRQRAKWDDFVTDLELVVAAVDAHATPEVMKVLIEGIGLGTSAHTLDSGRGNASRSGHFDDLVAVRRAAALHPDIGDFASWLATTLDHAAAASGVTLSSIHRVKGMEWDRVITFGADEGAMPHDLSDDLEEERRIFHVALTRAIGQAVILADSAHPSRFLAELDGSAPRVAAAPPAPTRRAKAARLVLPTGPVDADLVTALKSWRLDTSKRMNVPAFVIMHDSTVEAIAATKPTSERQLLAINGIGPRKLEDYGDEILEVVSGFSGGD